MSYFPHKERSYTTIAGSISVMRNGVARIFVWGGATRPMSPGRFSEVDQIQWGGGSSRNFPGSPNPTGFSGGGGVVTEIFRDLRERNAFAGGGRGSGIQFFSVNSTSKSSKLPHFRQVFGHSDSKNVTTSIRCRKKTFTKSLGGAMAPVAPPGYATGNAAEEWERQRCFTGSRTRSLRLTC